MTTDELIDNLILNENAYFYKKDKSKFIAKRRVKEIIDAASQDKTGRFLLKELNCEYIISEEKKAFYSVAVFKYDRKPTFIDESVLGWDETKLAYICIIDFESFFIIAKRNISGIKYFLEDFSPIDYEVLTSLFTTDDSTFEKFSMRNMNISDKSIRQKSLESSDLKENLSTLGLQSYTLSNLRIGNGGDKISLSVNSSRINKFGSKNNIQSFVLWADSVVDRIESFAPSESFLSSFATPQDYSSQKDGLVPISVLVTLSSLFTDYEQNRIQRCYLETNDSERNIDLISSLQHFERLLNITPVQDNGRTLFKISNTAISDMQLVLNAKSITIQSKKLGRLMLEYENGRVTSLRDYLNYGNNFIVTFDTPDLVYSNRKLFRDSRLLGNIDALLQIFLPFDDLNNVISEKGDFMTGQTAFTANSVFGFVERQFMPSKDFFICDDLGREWADHIGLDDESISFFHSKYKDSNFSASAFQDIIGQAQKNLGNLSPSDYQWPMKEGFWANDYKINGVQTLIPRIRKGGTVVDTVNHFKVIKNYPNLKKKVFLVINFISKNDLEDRLVKLANGDAFAERNEVIQILWFVSSLISSCYEVGTEVYICCKP